MGYLVSGDGKIVDSSSSIPKPVTKVNQVDYAALLQDDQIFVITGAVDRTVSLPSAVGLLGKVYTVEKMDAGVGQVIIDPAGAETILGNPTALFVSQFDILTFMSDGANWV